MPATALPFARGNPLRRSQIASILAVVALGACSAPPAPVPPPVEHAVRVPLTAKGGGHMVQVALAGVCCIPFLLDSGASDVSIPSFLFAALIKGGHITRADMIDVRTYVTASGTIEGLRFRMPPITVGGITVHGVIGSVSPDGPPEMLLLGQSFLQRFRSWSIDNMTNELVLR